MSKFFEDINGARTTKQVAAPHSMQYSWTFWHHVRGKETENATTSGSIAEPSEQEKKDTSSESSKLDWQNTLDQYLQTVKQVEFPSVANGGATSTTNIDSCEQLWQSLSNLRKVSDLPVGTELFLFKSGIKPVWEDPANKSGGRWLIKSRYRRTQCDASTMERFSLIWERLILRLCGGTYFSNYSDADFKEFQDDICGITLSVRKNEVMIYIWNKNSISSQKPTNEPQGETEPEQDGEKEGEQDGKLNTDANFTSRLNAVNKIIAPAISVIKECDLILEGADPLEDHNTQNVNNVSELAFDYRFHYSSKRFFAQNFQNDHNGVYKAPHQNKHWNRSNHNSHGPFSSNHNSSGRNFKDRKNNYKAAAKNDTQSLFANLGRSRKGGSGEPGGLLGNKRRLQRSSQKDEDSA
ncbi:BA75_01734T0 [Komagataella pastoris]|uniref:BA75_01734T0 n=1 Tax=Komagataella pastoris TaxID=4922 RepID=A0A1B2J558_PICPA|nr:BA75_01734T0 [Komagataella pastoris]